MRDAIQAARDNGKGSYTAMRFVEAITSVLADARKTFFYDEPEGKNAIS